MHASTKLDMFAPFAFAPFDRTARLTETGVP